MKSAQLEMGFTSSTTSSAADRPGRRRSRAHWWFERMRYVVEKACDWEAHPVPRPEQICFAGTYREIQLETRNLPKVLIEQQICE